MKKYLLNKPMFIILLTVLAFVLALKIIFHSEYQTKLPSYDVSVLCAKGDAEQFKNFRQGALQASEDLNVNLRFLYSDAVDGVNHQLKFLEQELNNDSDAMIMVPYCDHSMLLKKCADANKPIVYAYSHVIKGESNYVGADGAMMGNDFAQSIITTHPQKQQIAILVRNDLTHMENEMLKSMIDVLRSQGNQLEVLSFHPQESSEHLHHLLNKKNYDIVICFADELFGQLIEHKAIHNIEIYAMGSNYNIINALEKEDIRALLVQDDYSIGYLSVKAIVDSLQKGNSIVKQKIRYAIVDKNAMYQSVNERLLFPIVR